jgi:CheY-like chemotaxis protein
MDPLPLALAAGAYVAAALAKKAADQATTAAYNKIQAYFAKKLSHKDPVEDFDAETLGRAGLAADPEVDRFGKDVLARTPALRRAQLVGPVIKGARILWVDDRPQNNHGECRLLTALGAEVWQVRSTEEALAALPHGRWDLLLSDMGREGVSDAGLQMLKRLPPKSPPVVFYVGHVDESQPVPPGAFGIADLPEPLLHLVLDVLERHRV